MPPDRPDGRIRVLRIIARMNVGGPARHVSILSGELDHARYDTLLLTGALGEGEGDAEALADRHAVRRRTIPGLTPALRPADDLRALWHLVRVMRAWRPDIVHTHTAKAGTLGRLAVGLASRRRPVVVHTYHGHVLSGYFGPRKTAAFRAIERLLAPLADCLIGVSQATVDELVALRVAPPDRFVVVPIGLDLDRFFGVAAPQRQDRQALGAGPDDLVVTFVGRLVPIKRVDVLIEAVALARRRGVPAHLVIVGDGPLRTTLEESVAAAGLRDHVSFLGFRDDLPAIAAGTDVAMLTSANEGTPVALIEAGAAARPSVATAVGGVTDIVRADTGITVAPGDVEALAAALVELAADPRRRSQMGRAARRHVATVYAADRLVVDVDRLYTDLLRRKGR